MIYNDPSMQTCPYCAKQDAIVKLVKAGGNKYCPYHGKVAEKRGPQ